MSNVQALEDMRRRVGKRLEKIMPQGRGLFLAYDQGLEHGPSDFSEGTESADPRYILDLAKEIPCTAVVLQGGIAERYYDPRNDIPLIVKLNGHTAFDPGSDPTTSLLYRVERAERLLGATAVGYTIYPGSLYDTHTREVASRIIQEAHDRGMPAILWVYPRGSGLQKFLKQTNSGYMKSPDEDPFVIQYAARIGAELGADVIKIKYCGDPAEFAKAVRYAGETKVVLSGGPKNDDFLPIVQAIMQPAVGAAGVAVGRNIWQRPRKEAVDLGKQLCEIIGLMKAKKLDYGDLPHLPYRIME